MRERRLQRTHSQLRRNWTSESRSAVSSTICTYTLAEGNSNLGNLIPHPRVKSTETA